ncbi:MAG: hypothetical protein EXR77_04260 [Myxococcales bacterium]|nr:hypothetical protein [Myxococcales bacterium]
MDVATAIRTRRSHKLFAGDHVDDATLAELIELATWAPNHRFTEPWRFTVVPHPALPSLIAAIAEAMRGPDGELSDKARTKLHKITGIIAPAGAAIAVRQALATDDAERLREDYAACACAIQNMQLAAWSRNIASYWTTSDAIMGPKLSAFWNLQANEQMVGVVVLGTPAAEVKAVRYKRAQDLTIWLPAPVPSE